MAKYLKYLQLDADTAIHHLFNAMNRYSLNTIGDALQSNLKKIEFNGIAKIQIHFTQDASKEMHSENYIDTRLIHRYLPLTNLSNKSEDEVVLKVCEIIFDSLQKDENNSKDNNEKLEALKNTTIETVLNFSGYLTKIEASPSKEQKAIAYFKYNKNIEVGVTVYEKNKSQKNIVIFYYPPSLRSLNNVIGDFFWKDNETIIIRRRGTDDFWQIGTQIETSEFFFSREKDDNPQGIYDLGIMYLEGNLVVADHKKAITLLKKSSSLGYNKALKKLESLGLN